MICPHCDKPIKFGTTPSQQAEVRRLHKAGYSLRDIQQKTGVSYSTAGRIVRAHEAKKK